MKKLIITLFLGAITTGNAQVIIGDAIGTATVKTGVLLEFAAGQNKGMIVPYVRTLPAAANTTEGTILLDASNATTSRMKYYAGTVKGWVDLSGQDADMTATLASQPTAIAESNSKAIIGTVPNPIPAGFPEGALVLNSTTKAMVLPIVTDVNNIIRPSPGMMVYVSGVAPALNKRLAVFNGSKWSFFRP